MNKKKQARRQRALKRLRKSYSVVTYPSKMDQLRIQSEIATLQKRLGITK